MRNCRKDATVFCDASSTAANIKGQIARLALMMQPYDFTVVHRRRKTYHNADVPSRFPLPSEADHTGSRLDDATPSFRPLAVDQAPLLVPLPNLAVLSASCSTRCDTTTRW